MEELRLNLVSQSCNSVNSRVEFEVIAGHQVKSSCKKKLGDTLKPNFNITQLEVDFCICRITANCILYIYMVYGKWKNSR